MTPLRRSLAVLLYGFALLGMPGAALGVAWPSMADDLARDLGDLGVLTLLTGISYALVSLVSGSLTKRVPAGRLLVLAAVLATVGLVGYAAANSFIVLAIAAIPIGIAGGTVDAIGNAHVAVRHGSRAMGFIHASFGFGAMLAPLMMTALAAIGAAWRVGFALLAVAQIVLAVGFLITREAYRMPMEGRKERPERTGSYRLLGLSVWTFFVYAGVEGSTGFWAFTLLSEGQGVNATVAGLAVAAHWGALFASRLALGVVGDRVPADVTVTLSGIFLVVGLGAMWWNPSAIVSIGGLVVAGFASGPVFPLEVILTTPRFGEQFTPWAVGYQLAAATTAIAFVPAIIGMLVNSFGPLVIAPALVILAIATWASLETLRVAGARERFVHV
ncbi:MAG: MFS transporter [Acidimicrobiia bacterium]